MKTWLFSLFSLVFLFAPIPVSAQSDTREPARLTDIVSVHELSIPNKARKAFNKGAQLLKSTDWLGSIAQFRLAILDFPDFYEAYYSLGLAEFELGNRDDAEAAFRSSIKLSGESYGPPYFGLGMIVAEKKEEFGEAEALIRKGLLLDADNPVGYFALAAVLSESNRLPEAEDAALHALSVQPNLAPVYLLLGRIHYKEGNLVNEAEDLKTYSKLDPKGAANWTASQ